MTSCVSVDTVLISYSLSEFSPISYDLTFFHPRTLRQSLFRLVYRPAVSVKRNPPRTTDKSVGIDGVPDDRILFSILIRTYRTITRSIRRTSKVSADTWRTRRRRIRKIKTVIEIPDSQIPQKPRAFRSDSVLYRLFIRVIYFDGCSVRKTKKTTDCHYSCVDRYASYYYFQFKNDTE